MFAAGSAWSRHVFSGFRLLSRVLTSGQTGTYRRPAKFVELLFSEEETHDDLSDV